jgi:hypothetical protein
LERELYEASQLARRNETGSGEVVAEEPEGDITGGSAPFGDAQQIQRCAGICLPALERPRSHSCWRVASDATRVGLSQLAETQTLLALAAAIENECASLLVLRTRLVNEV